MCPFFALNFISQVRQMWFFLSFFFPFRWRRKSVKKEPTILFFYSLGFTILAECHIKKSTTLPKSSRQTGVLQVGKKAEIFRVRRLYYKHIPGICHPLNNSWFFLKKFFSDNNFGNIRNAGKHVRSLGRQVAVSASCKKTIAHFLVFFLLVW